MALTPTERAEILVEIDGDPQKYAKLYAKVKFFLDHNAIAGFIVYESPDEDAQYLRDGLAVAFDHLEEIGYGAEIRRVYSIQQMNWNAQSERERKNEVIDAVQKMSWIQRAGIKIRAKEVNYGKLVTGILALALLIWTVSYFYKVYYPKPT